MIYTCTITPSIDYTTYLPKFETDALNRTNEVYYYPGGKGINVSRVLERLGQNNIALGFAGGFTGEYIKQFLHREKIETEFIDTHETTRINVKIKTDQETDLNGPGPKITHEQQEKLLNKIQKVYNGDWLVLAGSLPDSIPETFYKRIAAICLQKDIKFVLDTSGPLLNVLTREKPFLIKPNQHELGNLFNTTISSKSDAIHYAKRLIDNDVQNVIVSLEGDGAVFVSENNVMEAAAPKGKVVNTVGSGDSLVSGFVASFVTDNDLLKAFRYGVASSSATAFQTDLCNKDDVELLVSQVNINFLNE